MKIHISILLVVILAISISAQTKVPTFVDYPVNEVYKGKIASAKIDHDSLAFRTRLRWAARNQKLNFAGSYILTFWGCGTSCIQGAVISAKTGKIYWWGFSTASTDAEEIVRYKLNSRLIVFHGARNEADGDDGDHYYKFDGVKFVHIKTLLKESK